MSGAGRPSAGIPSSVGLSISAVASRTGVTTTTLRMWQERYGLGASLRSGGGHRRYTAGDVDRVVAVKHLVDRGVPTAEAARSVLEAARHDLTLPDGAHPVAHELGHAALELDGPTVRRLLAARLAKDTVAAVWEGVLRPVLATIGDEWPVVAHGIAVEHLVSHVAATELARVTGPHAADAPDVLLASAPAELHDLPLVALGAELASTGRRGTVLGARTPTASLVAAADRAAPAAVVVLALTPEVADPEVLTAVGASAPVVAAGPGWDPTVLPAAVPHVDGLAEAAEVAAALSAGRRV
ncbi:MerR family transcriptional regulator [Pseudonocardia xishanensis]|uniref:MerR family transcriptional regulator n=1 Tax=Pseudonocardia xishanensis TaxID=630995 RepID=A0ABP8S331_9PSEU